MMQRPSALKPGDCIGLAATARKITKEEVSVAARILESWGVTLKYAPTLFDEQDQFAGSDEARASGLQALLDDPSVQAIVLARGGYGTVRMIDQLDFTAFKKHPKWIVGFSDATVLHSHIHRHCGVQTLHGPMLLNMQPERMDWVSIEALKQALMLEMEIRIAIPAHTLNREGVATGQLIGGNLSVLYSILGSDSDVDTTGKILFLEDLDEYLYHIDRMFVNLKRNGKLNKLAGIVIGQFSDMKDNSIPFGQTAEQIIRTHLEAFNYPVCFGFPAGHEKRNLAMRFGADAQLSVTSQGASLLIP